MKTLKSLVKISKYQTDLKRQALAEIESHIAQLLGRMKDLDLRLADEMKLASGLETGFMIGDYIANVRHQKENLQRQVNDLEKIAEERREDLHDAFREQKKFEIILANREKEELAEENKQEQDELDEISGRKSPPS